MIHIRLIGEPGVGKTRLILETLREKDLKPLVLYAEKGSDVNGSVMAAVRAANHARGLRRTNSTGRRSERPCKSQHRNSAAGSRTSCFRMCGNS
jgi:hypothetical protein